jgi:hypothetical protein
VKLIAAEHRAPAPLLAFLVLVTGACSPGVEEPVGGTNEPTETETPIASPLHFVDEAAARGIGFTHTATRTDQKFMPEILGAGVAVADFNRDGSPDLYFVGGGDLARGARRPVAARDRLFLNDGKGFFSDVSDAWGTSTVAYGMGVAVGDYDGDGWTDILLTTFGGGDRLLRNTGNAFEDVSASAGLDPRSAWGTSAGFFDYDNDGDLDVYITRYVSYEVRDALRCWHNKRHIYCSPALFDALSDTLLQNEGDGSFTDVSAEAGIASHACKGLALALGDIDQDGDVDAFLANDITRNLFFLNDGAGRFEERGQACGVAYDETGRASAGMGADFSDVDGNGLLDISCTNFQDETSNIYMQRPAGVFRDRAYAVGVGASGQRRLSFGVDFCDLDNDGDEDLYVANGHIDDGIESVSERIGFAQQDSLYVLGEDSHFVDVSDASGPGLQLVDVTRGLVSADLDGDQKLDLVLTVNDGPARLLRNESEGPGAVVLWLEGVASNRSAIGARVLAKTGERELHREVRGSSSYLSQCDQRVHLGLGSAATLSAVRILWPSGAVQELGELRAGFYHVIEGESPTPFTPGERVISPR